MPLFFPFPYLRQPKPPRYTVAWRAALECWQIEENGVALGILCSYEVEARAVCDALNFKRDILKHTMAVNNFVLTVTPDSPYTN